MSDRKRATTRAREATTLASAIRVRDAGTAFVSFDRQLRQAAVSEGFAVLPETA